jgi:hypothetical protein
LGVWLSDIGCRLSGVVVKRGSLNIDGRNSGC